MDIKTHIHLNNELDEVNDDDDLSVMALLRAEQTAQEVEENNYINFKSFFICIFIQYIGRHIPLDRQPSNTERVQATLETIGISMNYQLRSLIEWAKDLKGFVELSDNDKVRKENLIRK